VRWYDRKDAKWRKETVQLTDEVERVPLIEMRKSGYRDRTKDRADSNADEAKRGKGGGTVTLVGPQKRSRKGSVAYKGGAVWRRCGVSDLGGNAPLIARNRMAHELRDKHYSGVLPRKNTRDVINPNCHRHEISDLCKQQQVSKIHWKHRHHNRSFARHSKSDLVQQTRRLAWLRR
jgi:hypothetical protein